MSMASISDQYYSDSMFSKALLPDLPTSMTSSDGSGSSESGMYGELSNNNIIGAFSSIVPLEYSYTDHISSTTTTSMASLMGPDHRLGVSSGHVAAALPDNYDRSLFVTNGGIKEGFASNYHNPGIYNELVGEEYCTSAVLQDSNFWPVCPIITGDNNNWEIQGGNNGMAHRLLEESTLKIARYSAEERKSRILRYLKKRSQRNFNKTIKYACRKTLADKRVRVRGRFARNNELSDDDQTLPAVKSGTEDYLINLQEVEQSCCYRPINDPPLLHQMRASSSSSSSTDEEWLQEAIASLMYYRVLPDPDLPPFNGASGGGS